MTISSYPYVKLLIAVMVATAVGVISDSVGWGIATFLIMVFIFIWVASWIFEATTKGKVEVTDELEELLHKLYRIGRIKNLLPLDQRGWCNSLGLFVQYRSKGDSSRVRAGDSKHHSEVDAWGEGIGFGPGLEEWKVKKYDPGDWEKLVNPTLKIANWLLTFEGLPEEHADAFSRAIGVFKEEGQLELPRIEGKGKDSLGGYLDG